MGKMPMPQKNVPIPFHRHSRREVNRPAENRGPAALPRKYVHTQSRSVWLRIRGKRAPIPGSQMARAPGWRGRGVAGWRRLGVRELCPRLLRLKQSFSTPKKSHSNRVRALESVTADLHTCPGHNTVGKSINACQTSRTLQKKNGCGSISVGVLRPFRAASRGADLPPGLCPGLCYFCPFRALRTPGHRAWSPRGHRLVHTNATSERRRQPRRGAIP